VPTLREPSNCLAQEAHSRQARADVIADVGDPNHAHRKHRPWRSPRVDPLQHGLHGDQRVPLLDVLEHDPTPEIASVCVYLGQPQLDRRSDLRAPDQDPVGGRSMDEHEVAGGRARRGVACRDRFPTS
jgi:hypothetical protein